MSLNTEQKGEIEAKALLLNGQLRGVINENARSTNLSLIYLTLDSIANSFFEMGYSMGHTNAISEIIKEDLRHEITNAINNQEDNN